MNDIEGVEVWGQWCVEPEVVRGEAKKLFEDSFVATYDFGVMLGDVEFKSLSLEDNSSLISNFTKEEIWEAVWQREGSKSPGLDGFNFNFIKNNWDVIKSDVRVAVHHFHETGTIPKGCKASFIALVPKVCDPTKLDQYRPIFLVGALYKIISKVLSCRMKNVLPYIIDESHSTFLKELRRHGRRGLCLMVNYEKAYDSVR